jgi:hypothetical protein
MVTSNTQIAEIVFEFTNDFLHEVNDIYEKILHRRKRGQPAINGDVWRGLLWQ